MLLERFQVQERRRHDVRARSLLGGLIGGYGRQVSTARILSEVQGSSDRVGLVGRQQPVADDRVYFFVVERPSSYAPVLGRANVVRLPLLLGLVLRETKLAKYWEID